MTKPSKKEQQNEANIPRVIDWSWRVINHAAADLDDTLSITGTQISNLERAEAHIVKAYRRAILDKHAFTAEDRAAIDALYAAVFRLRECFDQAIMYVEITKASAVDRHNVWRVHPIPTRIMDRLVRTAAFFKALTEL